MSKDSLVKHDSSDINQYMVDEDTRHKLNSTHYVLGENSYRTLQENKHNRDVQRQKLADNLGVEITYKLTPTDDIIKNLDSYIDYMNNKERYEKIINDILEFCEPALLVKILHEEINNPK